jgi:poly(A) polymerase
MKKYIDIISGIVKNIGGECYLTGGYVRDKLFNSKNYPEDMDLVYHGNFELLISELRLKNIIFFPLKKEVGIYRASIEGCIIDLSKMKGDTIEEDLGKRDFTLNSIALKLLDNKVIDPFKGKRSIQSRVLQQTSTSSIKSDPIRIIRGVRFCVKYGMHFNLETEQNIIGQAANLKACKKERLQMEFMKLIEADIAGMAFDMLNNYGILKYILPYIEDLKTVGKCEYHLEDAYCHMNKTYMSFKEFLEGRISIEGIDKSQFSSKIGSFEKGSFAALAAFCHDIGKYKSYKTKEGKVSFIGHEKVGAKIMMLICTELSLSKSATKLIVNMIEAHMYPLRLYKNNQQNEREAYYKFFTKYDEFIPEILTLSFCDIYATLSYYDPQNNLLKYKVFIERLQNEYCEFKKVKKDKLVNGNDIIMVTGIKGEKIKIILADIDKLRYLRKLNSKKEVLEYIGHFKI